MYIYLVFYTNRQILGLIVNLIILLAPTQQTEEIRVILPTHKNKEPIKFEIWLFIRRRLKYATRECLNWGVRGHAWLRIQEFNVLNQILNTKTLLSILSNLLAGCWSIHFTGRFCPLRYVQICTTIHARLPSNSNSLLQRLHRLSYLSFFYVRNISTKNQRMCGWSSPCGWAQVQEFDVDYIMCVCVWECVRVSLLTENFLWLCGNCRHKSKMAYKI